MSILSVYPVSSPDLPNKVLTHLEDIAPTLAAQGIVLERRQVATQVTAGASRDDVIGACQAQLDQLMTERGHRAIEVISARGGPGQHTDLRARLLDEQRHDADQVQFFVAGRGLLCLHIGDFVYAVQCEKHDLISIPAGTRHWFDIGEQPHLVVIRLFASERGKTATLTCDDIARRFPGLDD